ncbi:AraC family transcriptional regulator [Xanthomonas sp. AM6]|uniref:AraC family transcriptional regulator n=1 Tax=Xanthomonas sp. AM6 TaxID=2982531 RepID=UPI0021D99BDE|nr:AraC family transcriptional regulator [Xanthomonas sp. AM6]UYB54243.1 AraC family transcriptional regulator [Xanthomonas sp. AM6]
MEGPDTFSIHQDILTDPGLPFARLLARAGVEPSNRWTTKDFFRIWEAADREFDDRSMGLSFGANGMSSGYGIASLVALHAPDFSGALAALSRYKRLTCPELVEVDVTGSEAIVRYRWLQATSEVPRLLVDMTMASLFQLAKVGTGSKVKPIRLELSRPSKDREMLQNHFGCPVVFGAMSDAMVFERSALDAAFVTANGGAFARLVRDLDGELASGAGYPAPIAELRVTIARQLSEGRQASVAAVAGRLNVSKRTLQRRLDGHKTSFQQQLADVRRTIARRLLANTKFDTVAIAMALGFVEPNSFTRAFRSWEEQTPLHWRQQNEGARKRQKTRNRP